MCRRDQRDAGKRENEAKGKDRAHITQRLLNHGNNLVLYPTSTVKTFQCFMGKWGVCCDLLGNRSLCHRKTDMEEVTGGVRRLRAIVLGIDSCA